MRVATTRFGDIEIAEEKILTFADGLPGLERYGRYTLLSTKETDPFHWLQSLDDMDVALAVINPYLLFPDYRPTVPENVLKDLGIHETEQVLVLTVAVIPQDFQQMTTNLLAPILINTQNNQGRQVILENSEYDLRQPIYEEVQKLVHEEGGTEDARPD